MIDIEGCRQAIKDVAKEGDGVRTAVLTEIGNNLCSELDRVLDALEEMVAQHCSHCFEQVDSDAISTNRDAMKILAEYGRMEIVSEEGRMVIANWTKKEDVK